MAGFLETNNAERAYRTFCEMLDDQGWKYDRNDGNMEISSGAKGDDLPINILVKVDADKQLVTLLSKLPFKAPEEEIALTAIGVCAANFNMVDGSFDLNPQTGSIIFRLTTSIRDSLISKDAFEYMLYVSCSTIDNYNDKFLGLIKHTISLEEFLDFAKE